MDKTAPTRGIWDLDRLFRPRSVALIGASDTSRVGRAIVENLLKLGYQGDIYPVNPKYRSVLDLECYPTIGDVPSTVDAVLIATGSSRVAAVLEECGEAGVGAAVVTAGGFGEAGDEGLRLERALESIAREYGIALSGPNCMGILNTATGASLYVGVIAQTMTEGDVSVVLQSGSLGLALSNNLRGLGLRYVISSGNEAVLTAADYVRYLASDAGTRVIGLALESVRDPENLLAGVRAAKAAGKTVVLLKLGVSAKGHELAASHTGALAGRGEVTQGVCRQYGIGQVTDLEELLITCRLLARYPPAGHRIGGITLSGGYATLLADLCEQNGLQLPPWNRATADVISRHSAVISNPFDAWGTGGFEPAMRDAIAAGLRDPDIDVLAVVQDLPPSGSPHRSDVPAAVVQIVFDEGKDASKPIVVLGSVTDTPAEGLLTPLEAARVPYIAGASTAVRAIAAWADAGGPAEAALWSPRTAPPRGLDAKWLREIGIPLVPGRLTESSTDAAAAAAEVGFPVVLKVSSEDLPHKTEVGGVVLDVGPDELAKSYDRLLNDVRRHAPEARIQGVSVQRQVPPGLEVMVGALRDSDWGWVLTCSIGGIYVEVLGDASFRRVPVTESAARAMLAELRGYSMLEGTRGQEPLDVVALVNLIVSVSRLVELRWEEHSQIDFNPVVVHPAGQGLSVVDSLFVTADGRHFVTVEDS